MKAARAIVTHETARGFVTNDTSLAHSFNSFINALSIWMHSQKIIRCWCVHYSRRARWKVNAAVAASWFVSLKGEYITLQWEWERENTPCQVGGIKIIGRYFSPRAFHSHQKHYLGEFKSDVYMRNGWKFERLINARAAPTSTRLAYFSVWDFSNDYNGCCAHASVFPIRL